MRCKSVRRKLMAWHDGELSPDLSEGIARHLEGCPGCARTLEAIREVDGAARTGAGPDPGPEYWESFTERVVRRVREESSPADPVPKAVRRFFRPIRLAPALSAALVVVVAVGVLMKVREPPVPLKPPPETEKGALSSAPGAGDAADGDDFADLAGASAERALSDRAQAGKAVGSTGSPEEKKAAAAPGAYPSVLKREALAGDGQGDLPVVEQAIPGTEGEGRPSAAAAISDAAPPGAGALDEIAGGSALTPDDGSWGQLSYARKLALEGNERESEETLVDLLERSADPPLRAEASILLVSVLSSQQRKEEAREVLEEAQRLYPADSRVQNYRIE